MIESVIDMLPALAWPRKVGPKTAVTLAVPSGAGDPSTYLTHPSLTLTPKESYDLQVQVATDPEALGKLTQRAREQRFILHNYDGVARDRRYFYISPYAAVATPHSWFLPLLLPSAPSRCKSKPVIVVNEALRAKSCWPPGFAPAPSGGVAAFAVRPRARRLCWRNASGRTRTRSSFAPTTALSRTIDGFRTPTRS